MTRQKMSSSERALPITAISVYPRSSTCAREASAISLRDGDKIDIMRTIADSTVDTILKVDEKTFLGSRFSSPILAAFDEHRCVARDERNEPADFLVGLICFMFELVYPASRALAREQGDIHRLLDAPFGITRPFTDPATQATWSRLKDEMRDWLARA